ncbi:hypothetical protein HJD18_03340 [Thermoleophilia bacterium SCSIO 60948]|nr:hypothetical protein HJD18_03340 [Thermoleophilia bacterium SCSIO 60948]
MSDDAKVFFGYPSSPESSRETLASAAATLGRVGGIAVKTWEDLTISGQIVIEKILSAIDAARLCVFDITTLNENVLFEIGYAIGREKPIWLVRDTSDEVAAERWNQIGIVDGLGYETFVNSDEIVGPFMEVRPDTGHSPAIVDVHGFAERDPGSVASIFYMQGLHATNADKELIRTVEREREQGLEVTIADARESSVEALGWYVRQCARADTILLHLASANRQMSATHNARCGLVAGLARGMDKPVLMLATSDFESPFDYRDLLYRYENARDCADRANKWLANRLDAAHQELEARAKHAVERRRSSELASLRLGEHVAENESKTLGEYFVTTHLYQAVVRGGARLFVGRKGTGKTATLLQATREFERDRRVLACSMQPSSYDLTGFERVMSRIAARDTRQIIIEAFWKYLLYSQMSLELTEELRRRPAGIEPGTPEWDLDQYLRGPGAIFTRDFGVRIDHALERLEQAGLGSNPTADRANLANALHTKLIAELRDLIAPCLTYKDRVAVLVDNLDASWDPREDLSAASDLLLGLIAASRKVSKDLERRLPSVGREEFEVSVAVFLRSDIFERIRDRAPEPDKLPLERIEWNDEATLLRVVGERYVAAVDNERARPQELWERYFTGILDDLSPSAYVLERVIPRPRDIVWWCNTALDVASRRGHAQVTPDDLREAESLYSRFVIEAMQVELGSLTDDPEALIYAFAGAPDQVSEDDVIAMLRGAGVRDEDLDAVTKALIGFTFLGLLTQAPHAQFASDLHQVERLRALARGSARRGVAVRYCIHPAFHSYLEVGPVHPDQQALA